MVFSNVGDRLFVYGTLRRDPNHEMYRALARYSTFIGEGCIRGELYDLGAYPGILLPENSEDSVVGEVYALKASNASQTLQLLDEYEGCSTTDPQPHEYQRKLVRVILVDGTETDAWAYVLRAQPTGAVRVPGGDYLAWRRQKQGDYAKKEGHSGFRGRTSR